MKTVRIALINPAQMSTHMAKTNRSFMVPQNTLAMVAALTPHDDVQVIDELVEEVDLDLEADLVGITAMSDNIVRAYVIADELQARGVPVVMGGSHVTACPDEALQHCDAVVCGEAEGAWEQVVDGIRERKRLSGTYRATEVPDMAKIPRPRRDLIRRDAYINVDMVQTSRGCPYNCEFCSVHTFFGRKTRKRPVDQIVRELEEDCRRRVFFVDDTMNADPRFAKKLFAEMAHLNKEWIAQVTVAAGKDPELTKLMADSGCVGVFIGFESVRSETLQETRKNHNKVHSYADHVHRIHDAGIPILGAFVFGFDNDTEEVFDETLAFVEKMKLALAQFTILTPYPGTDLYNRWEDEGRLLHTDWWLTRHWTEVLYNPKQMAPDTLRAGWVETSVQCYRRTKIAKRLVRSTLQNGLLKTILVGQMNLGYRESVWNMATDMGYI